MWHFVQSKKRKIWICKAQDSPTGKLPGFQVGRRSITILIPFYKRLEPKFSPRFYTTDYYPVYEKVIPVQRHRQGKAYMLRVEQHNSNTRNWLARFRRRSKLITRNPAMIGLSLLALEVLKDSLCKLSI